MPLVRYKYEENQPWAYVEGDSWETEMVGAKCAGTNIVPSLQFLCELDTLGFGTFSEAGSAAGTPGSEYIGHDIEGSGVHVRFRQTDGSILTKDINLSQSGLCTSAVLTGTIYYWASASGWLQIDPLTFTNDANNGCYPAGCEFRVYLGSVKTFSSITNACPIAELAPDECPPNTCSVDCGTYVCCYGSDGISVFNYQK